MTARTGRTKHRASSTDPEANHQLLNSAVARLIADDSAKRGAEERAAWLEANRPEMIDPSSRYYNASTGRRLRRISLRRQLHALTREEWELQRLTWDYLNQTWSFQPAPKTTWRDYAVEAVSHHVQQGLGHLHALANQKDTLATEALADFTMSMVKRLNQLALSESHRGRLIPFARQCLAWPALVARRKAFSEDYDNLILKLQVGKDTIFGKDSYSRFNPKRRFAAVTMEFIERIEYVRKTARSYSFTQPPAWAENARSLSSFCKSTRPQWWAVVEQILDEDFADPAKAEAYSKLVTASSHEHRKKSVFINKIREEIDTLADIHRERK